MNVFQTGFIAENDKSEWRTLFFGLAQRRKRIVQVALRSATMEIPILLATALMKATAKYLRFHTNEILEAAARGEEVIVTWRGKPRARVVGLEQRSRRRSRNPAFGIWKDRDMDVNETMDRLREPRSF